MLDTKTRIASWVLVAIALLLTLAAMWFGIEMLKAMGPYLTLVWTAALGLVGYAYRGLVMKSDE